jgi:hypothetical protein
VAAGTEAPTPQEERLADAEALLAWFAANGIGTVQRLGRIAAN